MGMHAYCDIADKSDIKVIESVKDGDREKTNHDWQKQVERRLESSSRDLNNIHQEGYYSDGMVKYKRGSMNSSKRIGVIDKEKVNDTKNPGSEVGGGPTLVAQNSVLHVAIKNHHN